MEINAAHLHLVVNHLPIFATLFAIPVLAWGIIANQPVLKKLALISFMIAGLSAVLAVQTGEGAEEVVESVPGVSEQVIHTHEEAAELAQWLAIGLGAAAIVAFFLVNRQHRYAASLMWVLLLFSLAVGSALVYTAYEGGKIMHPELSADRPSQTPNPDYEAEDE